MEIEFEQIDAFIPFSLFFYNTAYLPNYFIYILSHGLIFKVLVVHLWQCRINNRQN